MAKRQARARASPGRVLNLLRQSLRAMYTLHPTPQSLLCGNLFVREHGCQWSCTLPCGCPLSCCAGSAVHAHQVALAGQLWSAMSHLVVLPLQVFVWNALVSSSQPELTLSVEQVASLLGAESADCGDQVCSLVLWSTSG